MPTPSQSRCCSELYQIIHRSHLNAQSMLRRVAFNYKSKAEYHPDTKSTLSFYVPMHFSKNIYHYRRSYYLYPTKPYRYICRKLHILFQKQNKIMLLCRLYCIDPRRFYKLFEGQAVAYELLYRYLFQQRSNVDIGVMVRSACKNLQCDAGKCLSEASDLSLRRILMYRDVTDEFISIAAGISEVTALLLLLNVKPK